MSTELQWSLILGAILPPLIAVIQRPNFSSHVRTAITVIVCVVAGLVGLAIEGKLGAGAKTIVVNMIVVIGAAVTFHDRIWRPLSITPRIESATSPSSV
jgi:hypothetical protein